MPYKAASLSSAHHVRCGQLDFVLETSCAFDELQEVAANLLFGCWIYAKVEISVARNSLADNAQRGISRDRGLQKRETAQSKHLQAALNTCA